MYMWRGNLWLLAEIVFMFRTIGTDITTHSNKACFAVGACSIHQLDKCSVNQRIAIVDAYYTGNRECDSHMCPSNFSNIPENTFRTKLGSSQLALVDRLCTSTRRCTSVAQLGPQLQSFTVLKYQCVDDENEINMCNGDTKQGRDISLKFGQGLKTDCFCYIRWKTDSTPGVIDFHLLGMSLATTPCTHLGIYTGENVRTYDCNTTLTPHRYLANGTQTDNDAWVNIRNPPTTSGRIWMQINGSKNFTVSCNTNIITTSGQEGDAGIHSSKACFAPSGDCSFHRLDKCKGNQRIAIVDAYHTDNTECGMQRCPANMTSITESLKRKRLSESKLAKVDEACTYKIQCRSQSQQGSSLHRFSVLKYKCIDDENEIGKCNGDTKQGSDISLLFVPGSLQTSCTCFIRTVMDDAQVSFNVNLLEMSLPDEPCTNISILVDEEMLTLTCKARVTPYRLLAFGRLERERDVKITIENPGTSKNIWIQITGTNELTVNCRSTGTTTPVAGQSSKTDEDGDVGAVAGGVTAAVLVILAVVSVLLWFKYKRQSHTKRDDVPASVEHPTYSGLSARDSANTYDALGQDAATYVNDKKTDNESSRTYENI